MKKKTYQVNVFLKYFAHPAGRPRRKCRARRNNRYLFGICIAFFKRKRR